MSTSPIAKQTMIHRILIAGMLLAGPALAQDAPAPERPDPAALQQQTTKPLSPREQALLDKIRQTGAPQWRTYGGVSYNWTAWKLHANGTRTTDAWIAQPGANPPIPKQITVGVSCSSLQINTTETGSWGAWRRPGVGEDEMVAALCANVTAPTPAPAAKEAKP